MKQRWRPPHLGNSYGDGVSDAMVRAVRLVAARCGLADGSGGNNACKSVSSLIVACSAAFARTM